MNLFNKTKEIKCCAVYDVPRALGGTVQETPINYIFLIHFVDIFCLNIHNTWLHTDVQLKIENGHI